MSPVLEGLVIGLVILSIPWSISIVGSLKRIADILEATRKGVLGGKI